MVAGRVQVDQYVAVVAFVYFGVKLLRDSYRAPHRSHAAPKRMRPKHMLGPS
jgi:hypothetical protein